MYLHSADIYNVAHNANLDFLIKSLILNYIIPSSLLIILAFILFNKEISVNTLRTLVQYMYTGELNLDNDTVWLVLTAAGRLQVPGAIETCNKYIQEMSIFPVSSVLT